MLYRDINYYYDNINEFKTIDQTMFLQTVIEENIVLETYKALRLFEHTINYKDKKSLWKQIVLRSYICYGLCIPHPYFRYSNKKFKRLIAIQYKKFYDRFDNYYEWFRFLNDFQYDLTVNEIKQIFLYLYQLNEKKMFESVLDICGWRLPEKISNDLKFLNALKY